jgi:integrase/recombinase XerD
MTERRRSRQLAAPLDLDVFEKYVAIAMSMISRNSHTQSAYWLDVRAWLAFCSAHRVDPYTPTRQAVAAWLESMVQGKVAPRTRGRRMSSLCSIYCELRREMVNVNGEPIPPVVTVPNPFSVEDGPRREGTPASLAPTPVLNPEVMMKLIETCEDDPLGVRDRAMLRVLWATGIRRSSLVDMHIERLRWLPARAGGGCETDVFGKGGKVIKIWIRGQAAIDLKTYVKLLGQSKLKTGPLWRSRRAKLTPMGIWHVVRHRAELAGVTERVSPHMFRVAFLTYNEVGLEAKQQAAGHADPATTRGYDRAEWRGTDPTARWWKPWKPRAWVLDYPYLEQHA